MYKKFLLFIGSIIAGLAFAVNISANTLGFDVSSFQPSDVQFFQQMKNRGATFDLVKLGGSGGGEGYHYQNPKASAQLANSAKVGLNVGGYFWGQFGADQQSAKNMANMAVSDAKRNGLNQHSVIALDYELGATNNVNANTAAIKVFLTTIKDAGYKPLLYSGASYLRNYINVSEINSALGTSIWVASYKTTNLQTAPDFRYFPSMPGVAAWQFGDNYFGVDGNVDLVNFMSTGSIKVNTPVKPTQPQNSDQTAKTYIVKSGDSWWAISQRVGVDMNLLAQLNNKTIKSTIYPGQTLKISGTIKHNLTKQAAKNVKQSRPKIVFQRIQLPAGVISQQGYFHPTQRLMVWRNPGYNPTGVYYYKGESIKYSGYIRNGSYIYVAYQTKNGSWRYVADRRVAGNVPLGWFE